MGKKNRSKKKRRVVDVDVKEIEGIIDATASGPLGDKERKKLRDTIHLLLKHLDPKFRTSEKMSELVKELMEQEEADQPESGSDTEESEPEKTEEKKKKRKGHGRLPAAAYTGAKKVECSHESLKPGDSCPACGRGKVYKKEPKVLIRVIGGAPLQATAYHLEKLKCSLCGAIFTAKPPDDVGDTKYNETVPSLLALLVYGSGFARHRLESLQGRLGIPLPHTTQWDLLNRTAKQLEPILNELIRQAAQGVLLHSDDTSRKILELERPDEEVRTGVFTTGIVSNQESGSQIALFFTGRKHAGENLADVLAQRSEELTPPILMFDALSRNIPKDLDGNPMAAKLANCLAHGRRYFVDLLGSFPEKCGFILDSLGAVFTCDRCLRILGVNPAERLRTHQSFSGPVMSSLREWLERQFPENLVEPNSGLGKAIRYLLNHWEKLTLFLREEGAPLDNNLTERALKKAILHRKNSQFFRTQRGADVGDLFTSLIHTCELNGVNPFDYLNALQQNFPRLEREPENWMPWNFTINLQTSEPLSQTR